MASNIGSFFNEEFYLRVHSDVAEAVKQGAISSGYEHFLRYGMAEGRNPNRFFDTAYYLNQNPDVASAVEAGSITAYGHFVENGNAELRSPTAFFNVDWYLTNNNDVAVKVYRGELTAYGHFFANGADELRQATPFFSPLDYMAANPDVTSSPLRHFAEFGIAENRDLGNGLKMTYFAQDTIFTDALFTGNFAAAFARVAQIAPFLPSFEKPATYLYPSDLEAPTDFVSSSVFLAVPTGLDGVTAPATSSSFSQLTIGQASDGTLTLSGTGAKAGVTIDLANNQILDGGKTLLLRTDSVHSTVDASGVKIASVTLTGTSRAETLTGSAQADTLSGGAGMDTLTGGAGADTFILASSSANDADTITDFVSGSDKIQLSDAVYSLTGSRGAALAAADYHEVATVTDLTGGTLALATDAEKIIVVADSGEIYFNDDGATAGGLTLIGVLKNAGAAVDPAIGDFVLG
ncbi:hemolysin-type calcium-binding region [Rhodospirillum rubrum]|uniref:M10 family metallopeptidase C-terminal domain-containing protein n=1 Tax=Rhodospirillum rubrum TaxID=1085 RepID=UPI001905BAAB|nr:M10 family metallopeptidase C-terminal domain-containing protein [Rhodospirillum rubrum]MBK1664073.1 hemolysin-type calcium-binding region [Rhodospirillum rubrum]MBK1676046.1 hemolysin-type calcium-binding region [Rhodospirillum rubrum]